MREYMNFASMARNENNERHGAEKEFNYRH